MAASERPLDRQFTQSFLGCFGRIYGKETPLTEQILNHDFSRDGAAHGELEQVDTASDDSGLYPTAILRDSAGVRRAVHFTRPDHIAKLVAASPHIGDALSITANGGITIDRPDVYGESGMMVPAAADWSSVAHQGFRRSGPVEHLRAEPVAPWAPVAPQRTLRRFTAPDGRMMATYDPLPEAKAPQIVTDSSGHLVTRR